MHECLIKYNNFGLNHVAPSFAVLGWFKNFLQWLVVPFTLPFACGDPASIPSILLCVKVSDAVRVKFHSGADPPLETVSGPYYWWTEPVWTDKPAAWSGGVSIIQFDNWLKLIKRNFAQSNITWPNKSNVVTVTVFANLGYMRKKTQQLYVEKRLSSRRPTNSSPEKQRLSPAKNFNSRSVCDENKSQRITTVIVRKVPVAKALEQ